MSPHRQITVFFSILCISVIAAQNLFAETLGDSSELQAVWATGPLAGSVPSYGDSIAVSPDGSIYLAGTILYNRDCSLGNGVIVRGGSEKENAFIAKYDASGNALWASSTTEGSASSNFDCVAVDLMGNAYAVGMVTSGVTGFGDKVQINASKLRDNMALVKYDANGKAQWVRGFPKGENRSCLFSVTASGDGVIVVGYYLSRESGILDLGPSGPGYSAQPKLAEGGSQALIAKFNSSGKVLWLAQSISQGGDACFYSVAVGPKGEVYASGNIDSRVTVSFGSGVELGPNKTQSPLVVLFDPSGRAVWARSTVGSPKYDDEGPGPTDQPAFCTFNSVNVDSKGDVYLAGDMLRNGRHDFGDGVTVQGSSKKSNPLIVKYDGEGKALWARSIEAGQGTFDYHSAAIKDGRFLLAGEFNTSSESASFNFGNGVVAIFDPIAMASAAFLMSYASTGAPQWVLMPTAKNGSIEIRSIFSLRGEGILLAGEYHARKNPMELGNDIQLINTGEYQHFIAKYRFTIKLGSVPQPSSPPESKATATQPPDQNHIATSIDARVRVRGAPNLQAITVGYLGKGDKVAVLEKSTEKMKIESANEYWYHIKRLSDGLEGWSYGQYIKLGE